MRHGITIAKLKYMAVLKILLIALGVIIGLSTLGNLFSGNVWPLGIILTIVFLVLGVNIGSNKDNKS
jgi:hypothetical protein